MLLLLTFFQVILAVSVRKQTCDNNLHNCPEVLLIFFFIKRHNNHEDLKKVQFCVLLFFFVIVVVVLFCFIGLHGLQ